MQCRHKLSTSPRRLRRPSSSTNPLREFGREFNTCPSRPKSSIIPKLKSMFKAKQEQLLVDTLVHQVWLEEAKFTIRPIRQLPQLQQHMLLEGLELLSLMLWASQWPDIQLGDTQAAVILPAMWLKVTPQVLPTQVALTVRPTPQPEIAMWLEAAESDSMLAVGSETTPILTDIDPFTLDYLHFLSFIETFLYMISYSFLEIKILPVNQNQL